MDHAYPFSAPQSRLQRVAQLPRPHGAESRVLGTPAGAAPLVENFQPIPGWKKSPPFFPDFLDYHSMWCRGRAAPPLSGDAMTEPGRCRVERHPPHDMFISQKILIANR